MGKGRFVFVTSLVDNFNGIDQLREKNSCARQIGLIVLNDQLFDDNDKGELSVPKSVETESSSSSCYSTQKF